jgi:hypothetical protein
MPALDRYHEKLQTAPAPGTGRNCHASILSMANYGVLAGLSGDQIHFDIRQAIPQGHRRISDREITDAINKALSDHKGGTFNPRPRPEPVVQDGKATLQRIINQGKISHEADLWESSPIRLLDDPKGDPALFLSTLFEPTDFVWIGDRVQPGILGDTIRTAEAWSNHFKNSGKTAPHIILNPLTGTPTMKKTGDGETFRGDGNVSAFKYCLVEFDTLDRGDQIRFWSAVKLPVIALIDSGGKSIHAWLDVQKLTQVTTSEEWATEIKGRLYDRILTPLGVDGACSNPARLSRLPGHCREEKNKYQRILWLSKEGQNVR